MPEFNGGDQRRILAFDFGTKRIGVAVGQEITGTATALPVLPAKDGIPDWERLTRLIAEWQPDAFLVGSPLNMDGSQSEMAARARKFCNRLHGRFHKPCFNMDERLSTFEAKSQIMSLESFQGQTISLDSMAAKLILESWFRGQRKTNDNE